MRLTPAAARPRSLFFSLLVAVALHGLVLSAAPGAVRSGGGPPAVPGGALQVRVMSLMSPLADTPAPIEAPARPAAPRPARRPAPESLPDDDYLPRELLTAAPTPIGDVIVDYPPQPGDAEAHLSGQLTLFIDEEGHVARIRADGPPLPAALEASARQAFLHARFTPGRVETRPVRARIRIEVRFDASPISR